MLRFVLTSLVMAFLAAGSALADDVRDIRIRSGEDSIVVSGRISGYDGVTYRLAVKAGQQIIVSMTGSNPQNFFNVRPPGSDTAIFNGSNGDSSFIGVAQKTGKYEIDVYLMRAAARRGESSSYKLAVTLPAKGGSAGKPQDFADGDAGGPDNWIVKGLAPGDRLNVRSAPNAQAAVVAKIKNGSVVRNLGCRTRQDGSRWCRIALGAETGVKGWVNGKFLREF